MTACTEARTLIHEIGGVPERPVKQAINRIQERLRPYLSFSIGRIENIWYGEATRILADEMDALRAAVGVQRKRREAGRAAAKELAALYLGTAERLRAIDPDYHSVEISRLEHAARALGDQAGPESKAVNDTAY